MTYFKTLLAYLICLMMSTSILASVNPIDWRLPTAFPNAVSVGVNYSITYTFINRLPLQLVHPLNILKESSPSSEFTYTDTCTGTRLRANESCTVKINLSPQIMGEKFVQLSIAGYSKDVVPLPQITTLAIGSGESSVVGSISEALPNNMQAGHAANYIFTFTNYGDTDATHLGLSVLQTTGSVNITFENCTTGGNPAGTLHANGGFCTVQGTFTPSSSSPAEQLVLATLTYEGEKGSPAKVSSITTLNPADELIVASLVSPNYLAPLMTPGAVYTIEFLFSNVSNNSVTLTNTGTVTCTRSDSSNCNSALSIPVSQCINGSLGNNQNCSLTTQFTAPAANTPPYTYTLTGSLGYLDASAPTVSSISTQGTVVSSLPNTRTLKLINNCGFTIWYSLNGAAISGITPPCPPGTAANGNTCFWENYVGSSNTLPSGLGNTDIVTIPATPTFGGIQWSGNISASLGCNGTTNCAQASCNNQGGSTSCEAGKGFSQPATQAEITMLVDAADNYDVEVINGFHIPISMAPYSYINGSTEIPASANNYNCGIPGNYFAGGGRENGFGSCNWQTATPPTPTMYYFWVGGTPSGTCPSCSGGQLCGINTSFQQVCGDFLGYWTPNQLCTSNIPSALRTTLQCDQPTNFNLQPPDAFNNTYTSLMACPVAKNYTGPTYNSCYSSYPPGSDVSQCCGCANWWDPTQTINGAIILANTTSQTCPLGHSDSLWTGNIQNGIQWMKKACPSVYVYPFDDTTSKFTCSNNLPGSTNSTSYVITFCAGNNGLPPGATEGRS